MITNSCLLRKPKCISLILALLLVLASASSLKAQAYIEHSRVIGSSAPFIELAVDASGNSYILGNVVVVNYPVTLGPVPTTAQQRSALTKLDPSGNVIWSRYLPFSSQVGATTYTQMVLQGNTLYLLGSTAVTDMPVTDGSMYGGGTSDILFAKVDAATGALLHNGYLGGSGNDAGPYDLVVDGSGNAYITYSSNSPNIPVTTGPAYTSGYDRVVMKLNASGSVVYNTYTGRLTTNAPVITALSNLVVENGALYLVTLADDSNNFSTTVGGAHSGANDFAVLQLDGSGNRVLARFVGGSGGESAARLLVKNGDIYLSGSTSSTDYPSTDGSSRPATTGYVLTKLTSSGNIVFSGYRGGMIIGTSTGAMVWAGGSLYLAFAAPQQEVVVTTTDGTSGGSVLMKIDPSSGIAQFVTRFGQVRGFSAGATLHMTTDNSAIYISSTIHVSGSAPPVGFTTQVTDGSAWSGRSGTFVSRHSLDGHLDYASFLVAPGSSSGTSPFLPALSNGKLYLFGNSNTAANFPVTMAPLGTVSGTNNTWTVLSFCPALPTTNTISPLSQTVCQNGVIQALIGNEVVIPSSALPTLYEGATARQQTEIRARYQWQVATSSTGPWTDIASGIQKDYLPPSGSQTFYYRRLVLPPAGCGDIPVSISSVAEVVVGPSASPSITSAVFNTCPGTPVDISLTATGGTAPYTYSWDNGIASTSNSATVTPAGNSVYTMTVTDANGCQQIGQAIVNAYAADAGPTALSNCAGAPVRLGAAPPAGLAGVTYSWTPTTDLDDPTIAQPLANPSTTTVYTVQMTVPISGGGTCVTNDNVTVTPVAGPATANFAGADQAICKGGTVNLGTAPEAGFTYTWSPGSYLSGVTGSTTTFNAGTNMPVSNPMTYTLTASRTGCTFTDQVKVAVLDVDAGDEYCGPRTVGTADKMPNVTGKTWLWEVVSGPGTITGATNTPTTTVSASVGTATVYRVTVSYLGASCSDEVTVYPCGTGVCSVDIDTVAIQGCPSTLLGSVTLRARPANLNQAIYTYTWSSVPAGGLSTTTGPEVTLTDNVERDITVTIARIDNPAASCSKTIHVNSPSWSVPTVSLSDVSTCPETPVAIGTTPVAGYTFTWQNVEAAQTHASNPTVSPGDTTRYPVVVQDDGSGCRFYDTVTVNVRTLNLNPGPDWVACGNSLITLGSPAQPGLSYSWVPQVASYQNSTTYQSAQPQVLVAASQDFTLTVSDPVTGCSQDSTVHIVIDNSSNLPAMNDTTICAGGSARIGIADWPGVTYSWTPATGLSSTTVARPIASPASTQTYTLTVTYYDAGGAPTCTKSGSVTVTVSSPVITMSDESICPSGAPYNLSTGVTVTGASTYAWSPAILVTSPNALNTTVKANPNAPTTFTLTATDALGCTSTASKVVSPINAAPEAGSTGFVCVGSSRTLGDAANTGTLTWTVTPAIAGTLSNASSAQPLFTPAAADSGKTFTFLVTQDIGGCINKDSVQVLVRKLTLPAMLPQTVCMNAPVTIGVTAQPGVTYNWTPVTGLSNANDATTTVGNATTSTVYTLQAVDVYGCSAS
ncbi:MAG TPA: hypothetical protein VD996_13920, partial [Chitinophagaceae bacterium]|nr:hypothetical protein [Chitinophagaceae bacterium]